MQRALVDYVRRRVLADEDPAHLADEDPAHLADDVRRLGNLAFALLKRGLGDYAAR